MGTYYENIRKLKIRIQGELKAKKTVSIAKLNLIALDAFGYGSKQVMNILKTLEEAGKLEITGDEVRYFY